MRYGETIWIVKTFLTAISHRGLRNDFFFSFFSTNLLFPISIWAYQSIFYLDISRHFEIFWDISRHFETFRDILRHIETFRDILRHFETFQDISRHFETFTDISRHFETFTDISIFFRSFQSRSDFGFLPNFFYKNMPASVQTRVLNCFLQTS